MTEQEPEGRSLGMRWTSKPGGEEKVVQAEVPDAYGGIQVALWPTRWPAIALQECVDKVQAAAPADRPQVRFDLPCSSCPEAGACLNAKRKELGPLLYDREILTNPRSSESSLFPATIWAPMKFKIPCVRYWRPPFSREHEYRVVQAWDIAFSEKTGGDYLVCITAYVHLPTGMRRILDVERWQRLSFDDQVNMIETKWQQFGADAVVIEADAAQQVWAQRVSKTTAVPVLRHDAGQKRDLAEGVPGLLISLSNRKWEIPWVPGGYHHEEIQNMLDEFEAFGWNEGKLEGVGEHDDTVMCFYHLSWGIDRFLKTPPGGGEHHSGHVGGARL